MKQWHEYEVKHRNWDELNIYAKAGWERAIKQVKIGSFSTAAAMLLRFWPNVGC